MPFALLFNEFRDKGPRFTPFLVGWEAYRRGREVWLINKTHARQRVTLEGLELEAVEVRHSNALKMLPKEEAPRKEELEVKGGSATVELLAYEVCTLVPADR